MTYAEYSETEKGREFNRRFYDYKMDAISRDGHWWATNCVTYAVMMEIWDFLCDDEEFIVPDEAVSDTAESLFDRVLRWARGYYDIGIVITLDHGDERFEAIKDAFSPVWKKVKSVA